MGRRDADAHERDLLKAALSRKGYVAQSAPQ